MDEIRELLARLTELTPDELTRLTELVGETYDSLEGEAPTPESNATLVELVEAMESVQTEQANREQAAADAAAEADSLKARMTAARGKGDEGDGDQGDGATDEGGEGATGEGGDAAEGKDGKDGKPTVTPPAEPVGAGAVTASGTPAPTGPATGRAAAMAGAQPAPTRAISPTIVRAPLLASAALRGATAGERIADREALAEHMAETLNRMPREGAPRGDVILASARWDLPAERQLGSDAWENARKMDALTRPQALVASGGICAPVNIDYEVPTWATDDRPLKAALPAFQADRGGLTFVPPPDVAALAGATVVWTEANDVNPTAPTTKNVLTVACASPQTVYVDAVPTRLRFGNMQGRFSPEQVAANTDLAMAAAARIAELNLLSHIDAASTLVSSAQYLGATRDLLATLDLSVAAYRYRHRIPATVVLTAIFPEWAKSLIRADLTRELAHDSDGARDSLMVTDQQIDDLLMARGVHAIWMLDGRPAGTGAITYPAQQFGAQAAGVGLDKWPNAGTPDVVQLVWNLFVEGTMQLLDGGQLDLGVVRDSTLDATNDYETFIEPFETVAFRGVEALTVVSNVLPNGGSGAGVAVTGYTAGD